MTQRMLRLGSRKSPMAITQSRQVADMITERTGRPVEIVGVTTLGDVNRAQLTQIGGTGVFVGALREALLGGEVDLAVHSLKDLPAGPAPGIVLAAVPPRDDPRDALIARDGIKLADLPAGARIGTGSLRRAAQLLALRGDLRCVPIRGNAGTRLAKVTDGELDAVVLACAGLARIGSRGRHHPGPRARRDAARAGPGRAGRGVPRRGCRAGRAARGGERPGEHGRRRGRAQPAAGPRAGCSAPVGGYATGTEQLLMRAVVLSPDGTRALRAHGTAPAPDAHRLGRDLAAELLRRGAADLASSPHGPDKQRE